MARQSSVAMLQGLHPMITEEAKLLDALSMALLAFEHQPTYAHAVTVRAIAAALVAISDDWQHLQDEADDLEIEG